MKVFIKEIALKTSRRIEMVDITSLIRGAVSESGVKEGLCVVYSPHTTAAITVNENADPSVRHDIENKLSELVPYSARYSHLEGNADAHIKTTKVGPSETLIVTAGALYIGTWQGVFFAEFDGPRSRRVVVRVMGD